MTVNSEQLIEAVAQLPLEEKLKVFEKIKDDILPSRLESLLAEIKTDSISEEEITEIVENVRTERFQNRR